MVISQPKFVNYAYQRPLEVAPPCACHKSYFVVDFGRSFPPKGIARQFAIEGIVTRAADWRQGGPEVGPRRRSGGAGGVPAVAGHTDSGGEGGHTAMESASLNTEVSEDTLCALLRASRCRKK
eukprot:6177904-Pleurochrysis_carterae.AAC.1